MLGSLVIKILRIDGARNLTLIETSFGFFSITGNGFFKINDIRFNEYRIVHNELSGLNILEVKSDLMNTVINLSNQYHICHNIDTGYLIVTPLSELSCDEDYLSWYNSMQELTNAHNFV